MINYIYKKFKRIDTMDYIAIYNDKITFIYKNYDCEINLFVEDDIWKLKLRLYTKKWITILCYKEQQHKYMSKNIDDAIEVFMEKLDRLIR